MTAFTGMTKMKEIPNKKIAVIYHADCPDGFGASYAAWKKFGDNAEYIPAIHNATPPSLSGKEVYFVDFMYSPKDMERVKSEALLVVIIDHHASNEEFSKVADQRVFDNGHSASVLAWQYFFPDKKVPLFLKYVEDVDIWKFLLPDSKKISNAMWLYPFDYNVWDKIISDFEDEKKIIKYINEGDILLRGADKTVESLVSDAKEIIFEGYDCLISNSPVHYSFLGHSLAMKKPPVGIVWCYENGRVSVSLRSDGTVDVSKLAAKYGGGGHKSAAGFELAGLKEAGKLFGI